MLGRLRRPSGTKGSKAKKEVKNTDALQKTYDTGLQFFNPSDPAVEKVLPPPLAPREVCPSVSFPP
jgi:hypothetical protein